MVSKQQSIVRDQAKVNLSAAGVVRGASRLLPVSILVSPFGIAFGVAATEQGLEPIEATAISALVFTATAQFAGLDFLREPIAHVSLGLVVLALSARHIVMGAALSKWVNQLPFGKRFLTLFFLSDANFADSQLLLQRGENDLGPLLGGGLILWLTWVTTTAIGAFGGNMLGDTDAYGFGVVMVCFFAATAFGMVQRSSRLVVPAIIAAAVSVISAPVLPDGWNIILAALTGGAVAALMYDG